ncbi:MAG: hypothetical protein QOD86_1888 [Miltoncostaeaceae bacterium]|nr:hypothetical protein [Miltoncostaeaceae bacterium]
MTSIDLIGDEYEVGNLEEAILGALRSSGRDLGALRVEDLAPVDHFHMGGFEATLELLGLANPAPGAEVLDVGGGLGGAARTLANRIGARVMVLDATAEYCRVGERLTDLVGLRERVAFRHGDACEMPFANDSFDLVWLQHATMNIPDKPALFREAHRVLRPDGRLAMHEVMAGENAPIHFPVPWAGKPPLSHLSTQPDARALIASAGLVEETWRDVSAPSLEWWRQRVATVAHQAPSPLGLHLLMGAETPVKARNMIRNLEERRIAVVQALWLKPRTPGGRGDPVG